MIRTLCVFLLVLFIGGLFLYIRSVTPEVAGSAWVFGVFLSFNFITGLLFFGACGGFN